MSELTLLLYQRMLLCCHTIGILLLTPLQNTGLHTWHAEVLHVIKGISQVHNSPTYLGDIHS